jgi:hypothetical protein
MGSELEGEGGLPRQIVTLLADAGDCGLSVAELAIMTQRSEAQIRAALIRLRPRSRARAKLYAALEDVMQDAVRKGAVAETDRFTLGENGVPLRVYRSLICAGPSKDH